MKLLRLPVLFTIYLTPYLEDHTRKDYNLHFPPFVISKDFLNPQFVNQNVYDTSAKAGETLIDMDPNDKSIDASFSRNEILKILDSLNISFAKGISTVKLNTIFVRKHSESKRKFLVSTF